MKWIPPMFAKRDRSSSEASLLYPGWEWAVPAMLKSIGDIHSDRKLWLSPYTVPGSRTISSITPSVCLTNVNLLRSGLAKAYTNVLRQAEIRLKGTLQRLSSLSPDKRIALLMNQREMTCLKLCTMLNLRLEEKAAELKEAGNALRQCTADRIRKAENTAARLRERLTAVSPMAVLSRGYAMVYDREEKLLTRAEEARKRDGMILQFADGRVEVARKDTK